MVPNQMESNLSITQLFVRGYPNMSEDNNLLEAKTTYKSFWRLMGNVLAMALGGVYFGYSLAYISTIPMEEILNKFGSDMSKEAAQGFLSGIIPVGAGVGAWLSSIFNKKFSRKNSFIVTASISIIGTVFTLIPVFATLIIGRIIQGLCVGLYSAIVPLFINELSPIEVSGKLGALNQLLIVFGIVITNVMALFVPELPQNHQIVDFWWVIFGFPLLISGLQILLLLLVYRNETPRYLLSVGRQEEALELIRDIYKEEYVEDIIRDKKAEVDAVGSIAQNQDSVISGVNEDTILSPKAMKLCILVAVHLAVLQQFCGVNVVVVYGGEIINKAVPNVFTSKLMQVFLISTQFIACVGTSFILGKIGRKALLQLGTGISTVVLMVIGVAFLALDGSAQQIIVITSLYIFMTSFGFTLGPVVWLYIPEIVPANVVPYTTLANWAGASITIILFPILGSALPDGSLFFFFAGWCVLSLIFNHKYVVETKNQTDKEIKRSFNKLVQ